MLFQPTNILPDTRSGIGFGVVDATNSADNRMQVSWQVNGDYPVMTAFRIIIYQNNAASTQLYDTGKLTAGCPFYGRDASGEIAFFSYSIAASALASAGITNGNEYKYTIRQYYMENGAETSILQSSASVFVTRAAPTFTMTTPSVTTAEYTFTWNFSQAQGDTVEWIRYQIQVVDGSNTEMIYDSGSIYGAAVYECTYSGFIAGKYYSVRALGQTSSGVPIETDWVQFAPTSSSTAPSGSVTASCTAGLDAIFVSWDGVSTGQSQDEWVLYRQQEGKLALQKIGEFPISQTSVYDFGAASGQGPYTYLLFQAKAGDPSATPATKTTYLSGAVESNEVAPTRYYWALLDCEEEQAGVYRVKQEYDFKNNLDSGTVSNNNSPNVLQNFTAFPAVQLSPANYKSGTLSALIGKANMGNYVQDTLALREALLGLSTTQNELFLKSSKGDVMTIKINGAISFSVVDTATAQPQSVSVPWIEIDDTPVSIVAYPGDPIFNN